MVKKKRNKNINGWIALHRKLQYNFLWKECREFSKAEAWIDMLWEVQHSEKPQKVVLGMRTLTCNYGESLKSLDTWAERWNWSKNKVWRFLRLLEREEMVVLKSERITTRLTVCNYANYDPKQNANRTQIEPDNNGNNDYPQNSNEFRLSELLFNEIKKRKSDHKRPKLQQWCRHIDRMIRIDKRTPERIAEVIRWCQVDSGDGRNWKGWQNNILSTAKLREKFDKLELGMGKQSPPPEPLKVDADGKTPREKMLEEIERTQ